MRTILVCKGSAWTVPIATHYVAGDYKVIDVNADLKSIVFLQEESSAL